ncbi:hypothetical protein A3K29_03915 [Candidatus Collierbacteria bacterium RIFOXYB2_FULL_46_14]|uniref:Molecular chaperone-like protein n=1 Tax=Candidatus Collierbacteria bacterium GW2011_GWA2_46_26 TaxID=1618381 RepID=A0A0G1PIP6_9BACT|nr:MAG: Molecular chaperone-like protein [Candidatus Collierbacteria bacterium GW2011_GWC2_44_13]KKU32664.1 MAG: Molecular chaperone-like protein [Candidatus Collierbacteria bacterium GW2011_GWA2_46_26]OGD73259.1 MAG: hypothetical protein A3K29_03915 [Candidatus Collierbacteria bacterium RIFOXYB2_FULL_46_14]OGD76301.1 MAG: hypothetical protein A3K43_03915 [Candidatus Collierbacteria bacterium RIFOXYA2_FULL_46_20]OGD77637.1 MAG: hypothetical protein A3K39_03915 [Candidatus Collierbacteria bacter
MAFYGLDFGTTNTSLSTLVNGEAVLMPVDQAAENKGVARSALYFYPRKLMISNKVNKEQLTTNTFMFDQVWYEGEEKVATGNLAVKTYLNDNKSRHEGVKRRIYTGKYNNVILYTTPSGKVVTGDIPDYYEEVDFGTGRLFHALKTALKSPHYKGARVFGKEYTLEEMIGKFVSELKKTADLIAGETRKSVVCGRPVSFSTSPEADMAAQDRLEKAIRAAGFDEVKFQFEPVAAAKYYLSKFPSKGKMILVFDFGGGTFDTTIMEVGEEKLENSKNQNSGYKVLATDGVYVGGDLLNSDIFYHKLGKHFGTEVRFGEMQMRMPGHIIAGLRSWFGIPNLNNPDDIGFLTGNVKYKNTDPKAIEWLLYLIQKNLGFEMYEAIEVAKKLLTNNEKARIVFKDGLIDIDEEITRLEFEKMIQPRVLAVRETVLRTIKNADLEPKDIDVVVRTGGSSLVPVFEKMLEEIFGKEKVTEFDPFTSVAAGLALE